MKVKITSLLFILICSVLLCGCATTVTKGRCEEIADSGYYRYIPEKYIEIKGIGKGEFPDGTKGSGEPMIKLPSLPDMELN